MTSPAFSEEKLTAYALGELSPDERHEIEAEIAAHPELQAELEAIQMLATQLREELSLEEKELPLELPLGNTLSDPKPGKVVAFPLTRWFYLSGILAAAACAAFLALPYFLGPVQESSRRYISPTPPAPLAFEEDVSKSSTQTTEMPPPPEPMPVESPDQMRKPSELSAEVTVNEKQIADGLKGNLAATDSVNLPSPSLAPAAGAPPTRAIRGGESMFGSGAPSDPILATADSPAPALYSSITTRQAPSAPVPTSAPMQPAKVEASGSIASTKTVSAEPVRNGSFAVKDTSATSTLRREEDLQMKAQRRPASGESYAEIKDNSFLRVSDQALSTFSIDVDTGSYTNLRRFLNQGQFPPKDAVRIEEMVNYFNYNYPQPKTGDPFSVTTEVAKAPWKDSHFLVRIGLQGKTIPKEDRPPANLVFLIDVSGSMNEPNKLPLVIDSLKLLVGKLKPDDRVGIAVYAGNSGMVLPSTAITQRNEILQALSDLRAGGSTNGAMGIQLAYDMAKAHFIEGGINRVILCTDGDFNVGVTDRGDLLKLIEEKAQSKVFLSVFGFGMGNLQDATLEQLADKGNGNYGYIDNPKEAKRVFVDKLDGTLQTIAKDVKIQVEFNPALVGSYRLIGYENRILAAEDFNNDKKDAGEIGSGHRVTALYEVIPVGVKEEEGSVDPLKYQKPAAMEYAGDKSEIMNVKLRYKQPDGEVSKLLEHPVKNQEIRSFVPQKSGWFRSAPAEVSGDFQFAASVAAFGMILRDSPYKGEADLEMVLRLAGKGATDQDDRKEFIGLVKKAQSLLNEGERGKQE